MTTVTSESVRFGVAFGALVAVIFGTLGYGYFMLLTGHPGLSLAAVGAVWVESVTLPRPLAWLVRL